MKTFTYSRELNLLNKLVYGVILDNLPTFFKSCFWGKEIWAIISAVLISLPNFERRKLKLMTGFCWAKGALKKWRKFCKVRSLKGTLNSFYCINIKLFQVVSLSSFLRVVCSLSWRIQRTVVTFLPGKFFVLYIQYIAYVSIL